jgi:hypothetical protein
VEAGSCSGSTNPGTALAKICVVNRHFWVGSRASGQFFDLISSRLANDYIRLTQGNRDSDYYCICFSRKEHRGSTV